MIVKNEKLVNSVGVLSKLNNMDLNIKVSYAIAKNINKIEKELEVYNKEKAKLIDKYGEKDEEGKLKTDEYGNINVIDKENWNKEFKELLEIENEIDLHKINEEDLFKCHNANITPGELILVDYMF